MKMKSYLKRLTNDKRGFTLIEMIVVIAIIGILAAILVPSFSGYLSNAKGTKESASARTFYTAAQAAVTSLEGTSDAIGANTYQKETNSKFSEKIEALLGAANYAKIEKFSVTVDANGAVTSVTVKETGSNEVTYPDASATPTPSPTI